MSRFLLRRWLLLARNINKDSLHSFKTIAYSRVNIRCYSNKNVFDNKHLTQYEGFVSIKTKNKETYLKMIDIFMARDRLRTGHIEFIYSALKHMKDFGVHKDLEVYKKLIDVFPKGKMIPQNMWQAEFMHYPKHQQCAIDLLEQMEENGVMADWEMEDQLVMVFGRRGYPVRRYWRMMYWMPKFRKASPWPLPQELPTDTLELAKLAIERITSVDPTTQINVFHSKEIEGSLDDTWIVSGQSETQEKLISEIPEDRALYVDGGQRVWIRDRAVSFFTLSTDPFRRYPPEPDPNDVSDLMRKVNIKKRSVHEGEEDVILGVGSSGTSSPDSMLSWVRALSSRSPALSRLRILFRLSPSTNGTPPLTPYLHAPRDKLHSS